MNKLKIHDWDIWQTYRNDRGQPPWIKIHREIMRKPKWVMMSDAERGQLVSMWILAADEEGYIPNSSELIGKLCYMSSPVDLEKFKDMGWIDDIDDNTTNGCHSNDARPTPDRRQHDQPEIEAEGDIEEEKNIRQETALDENTILEKNTKPKIPLCPHEKIKDLYHEVLPELRKVRVWTPARQKILAARWKEKPERQNLEWWKRYFEYVRGCAFLMGKVQNRNGSPPFEADLEWLVRPQNFIKVIEGKYEGRQI